MAITVMAMVRKRSFYLILALLNPSLANANEWEFSPSLKINETYSDNINFDTQNASSSFVNQTSFGLITNYESARTSYDIDFEAINALYTHDSDFNDVYITLSSRAKFDLWLDGLAFEATASIQNQSRNTADNLFSDLLSGDTVQVGRYTAGLSYYTENSSYSLSSNIFFNTTDPEDNLNKTDGISAILNSQSGPNAQVVFWDITNRYTERDSDFSSGDSYQSEFKIGYITPYKFNPFIRYYDEGNSGSVGNGTESESNSYGVGFRWLAATRLNIDLSYNFPIDDEINTNSQQEDNYFDVNVSWQPTQRTSVNIGRSQRFYGDSYSLNLTHRNKRLTNSITYNESIQVFTRDGFGVTIDDEFCSFANSDVDCIALLQQFIIDNPEQEVPSLENAIDNSFSLNKTLSLDSTLNLNRTTLNVNLNRNDRLNLDSNIESLTENVSFSASRELSRYSNLAFSARYTANQFLIGTPSIRENQYRYYTVSYNRRLNNTLTFDLSLTHLNRTSDPAEFVYKENRISFELKKVL